MCILLEKRFTNHTSVQFLNRISMKQLRETLQQLLTDVGVVLLNKTETSIIVHGKLDSEIISQIAIERTIHFCYLNGLHFYFDTVKSDLVLYQPDEIS